VQGYCRGLEFVGRVPISDLGGVGTIILKSSNAVMAIGLLLLGFAITFGSCAMGIGVMKYLPEPDEKKSQIS